MHEVEVKAVLEDTNGFVERLMEYGCELGPEILQQDTVFVRETGSVAVYLSNPDFLRLRVEDGERTLFTFKHHPMRVADTDAAPLELEVEVSSREAMEKILLLMGYQEAVSVTKRRRKGAYKGWEVCVDEVDGLGSFVELEEMVATRDNVATIQKRMTDFLLELGVDAGKRFKDRYDILLLEKREA